MRSASIVLAVLLGAFSAHAQENSALAAAMKEAKVSLASGLKASEKEGRPISGKFEVEDGKVAKAEKANAGYKAVSVGAEIENGAAEAAVALLKGTESKQVEKKL